MFILCIKGMLKIYAQDFIRVVTVASTVDKMLLRIGLVVWTYTQDLSCVSLSSLQQALIDALVVCSSVCPEAVVKAP